MTAFELAGKLKLDSSEFSSSLNKEESKFKKFGDKLGGMAKKTAKVAAAGMATVGAGTVMFMKSSVQEGLNFDKAMSQVAATLGKSTDEIQELSKFAREMGSKTAFSATEAAEALNYMALAGYDSEKSMRMLPTVLNLAAAGNIDLAKASDMVTDAQSALGLSIEETERMVDQMAKTSSKTNTSVEQLGDAFLTVGGTAKMMGKGSIDATTELSMALGVLADNGIKGAEGGTMLRNILLSLTAPTDKAKEALQDLGISVFDAEGNMRDLPDIMTDINEATKGMTQAQRTNFLNTVFNKRDLKAVEAMLGTDISKWQELYGEINNAGGAAEQMAATQLDNLAGDLTIFKSALSEAKISLSDKLAPTLRKVVQRATTYVNRLTQAFNEKGLSGAIKEAKTIVKELITESLGIASDSTWLDIGKTIAGKLKEGLKTKLGQGKVKLANWLGLTDADGNAVDDPSDVSWLNITKAVFDKIRGKFKEVSGAAKVSLANWLGLTDEAGNAVDDPDDTSWLNIAKGMKDKLKNGFEKLKVKLADLLGITPEGVGDEVDWSDIGKNILEKLTSYFSKKGDFLKKLILGDEYTDKSTWSDVGKKISGWLTEAFADGGILNAILQNGSEKATAIAEFAGNLVVGLANWISANTDTVVGIITTIANAMANAAGPVVKALGKILTSPELWTAITDMLANIGEALLDAILGKDITNGIRRFFGVQIPGEVSDQNMDTVKVGWLGIMDRYLDDPSQAGQLAAEWNDFMADVFNKSNIDPSLYNDFMDQFDFDNMLDAFQTMSLNDFYSALNESLKSLTEGATKVKALKSEAEDTAGDYTMTFHIETDGDIPTTPHYRNKPPTLPGHAKGLLDVPYDNYVTRLHRDEMVLTASQARQYRKSRHNDLDMEALQDGIVDSIRVGMSGAQVNSYMDSVKVNRKTNNVTGNTLMSRRFAPA